MAKKQPTTKAGREAITRKGERGRSRPPEDLTDELIAELSDYVGKGNFRSVACQRAGIHPERFSRWLSMGIRDRKDFVSGKLTEPNMYIHLVDAMEKAEGGAHAKGIEDVMDSGDPRLVLEFLKLRYNKLYSKNPNARIDDEDGTEHKIDAKALLLEKINAILGDDE